MAVYSFKTIQQIPVPLSQAWDFFPILQIYKRSPRRIWVLKRFPNYHGEKMYTGQVIEYKVRPVLGIPLYWMTEITHVTDQVYFIDEQRFGPYSLWHHQHHFKPTDSGVEMKDIVHYKIPFWIIGDIANFIFVKRQVKEIFDYRRIKIEELFGK